MSERPIQKNGNPTNNAESSQATVTLHPLSSIYGPQPSTEIEDQMIIEINRIIGRYLSRPDWPSPYRCTFDWTIQAQHTVSYSVLMVIKEPACRP